jgi:PE family
MSLLSVAPDIVSEASGKLENLGSALRSATAAAASQTTAIAAPAEDQVSVAIAALLGTHGQEFQTINAQAAAFHDEFVSKLSGGAAQYVGAELTNAQQTLANTVNAPAQALLGNPVIGPGPAAATPLVGFTQNFGPVGVSLSTTIDSFGAGGLLGTTSASAILNTPFGVVPLLAAGGTSAIASNGQFLISLAQNAPFVSCGASMTGGLLPGLQITELAFSIDGLTVSLPGTYLGGLLPNVSFTPPH